MTKARTPAGLRGAVNGDPCVTVPPPADTATTPRGAVDLVLADPTTVRRIRLHHVLTRRRRWSKALDRLLGYPPRPYDPWSDPEFLAQHTVACDLAGVGRG